MWGSSVPLSFFPRSAVLVWQVSHPRLPLALHITFALARSTAKPLSHTWTVASRNGVVRDRMALFYNDFEEFVFPNGLFDCKGCLRGTDACENKIGWAWCYLCPSSIQGLTCHQFCGAT